MDATQERRQRRLLGLGVTSTLAALAGAAMLNAQAPETATLTMSIKGSSTYAQSAPVTLQTALLVITPTWEDMIGKTPVGGREASDQPLFMSDLAVVLSNLPMDCAGVFKPPAITAQDFIIVVGRAEAYSPSNGWQSTPLGKALVDAGSSTVTERTVPIDRFSLDAQYMLSKKKTLSKDGLRGGDGRLTLSQKGNGWMVDFMAKADELLAEGKVPVKSCGVVTRKKADVNPLLGERRLQMAADRYGL